VGTETSLKLIPQNQCDVYVGIAVCLPPIHCHTKELVCGKKNFLAIHALGDHELLLYPLEPIFSFDRVHSLRDGGGGSSNELSQTGFVRRRGWRCLLLVSMLVRLHVVEGLQHNLQQIVLDDHQLLEVDGVVVVGVARLAVALDVPCVHHLIG
jgi:hypothetical protein